MNGVSSRAVAVSGSGAARASNGIYRGFSFRNTSGAVAAQVDIYDNASAASGTLLDSIALAAGESAREWYDDGGLWVENGIYVNVVSGAVTGSVRVG